MEAPNDTNKGGFVVISPIKTQYKGHTFRSRTEARWAVFFDTLSLEWDYEKEGFETEQGLYLPDFWLPYFQVWIEIKGKPPTEREMELLRCVAEGTETAAFMFYGSPHEFIPGFYFGQDVCDSGGGTYSGDWTWEFCSPLSHNSISTQAFIVNTDDNRSDRGFVNFKWEPLPRVITAWKFREIQYEVTLEVHRLSSPLLKPMNSAMVIAANKAKAFSFWNPRK